MNLNRVFVAINIASCVILLVLGIMVALTTDEYDDKNYYFIAAGVLMAFTSAIGWSHYYSKSSQTAKRLRNILLVVFIGTLTLAITSAIVITNNLNF